jgi:hypothetical protein
MENGATTGMTRNGLAGEHQVVSPPDDDTVRTESDPTGDAPTNVPAENIPSDGLRTDTANDDPPPEVAGDTALTEIAIEELLADVPVNKTLAGMTPSQIVRDKRKSWKSCIATDSKVQVVSADTRTVRKAVRERFAKACDSSIRKRLASLVFEPASPFDAKVPRQLRLEACVLGSMLVATAVATVFFNICARLGR